MLRVLQVGSPPAWTEAITVLFNPRTQQWHEHFSWSDDGIRVEGTTPVVRTTTLVRFIPQ